MPKKSQSSRRAASRNKRGHTHPRKRTQRKRGGADALEGAPVKYSLAGSWPSRMSLGQGQDYFKYHVGQHGGSNYNHNHGGAPLRAITDSSLPDSLRSHAMLSGLDGAIKDISGLKDQAGGRRTRRRHTRRKGKKHGGKRGKKNGKSHHKKNGKSHRKSRRTHRKRGGNLGYAPFPSAGMLLSSPTAYAQAGLNPEWKTDVAFDLAKVRDTQ